MMEISGKMLLIFVYIFKQTHMHNECNKYYIHCGLADQDKYPVLFYHGKSPANFEWVPNVNDLIHVEILTVLDLFSC